ncbi:MAG: ATP-binding protein [Planctomycetaceae bacterium]|nr:ATP-binding protein [Planctomycetaceae bacterium]
MWSREIPFKVDIAGVIEIMGTSLYSRMDTPIRELIQNAHDAVMRRRRRDLEYKGRIDIQQNAAAGTLTFTDDGVGLSPDDAERFLGTLGIGITGLLKGRGTEQQRELVNGDGDQLIGQFGIGLFSAFMLADRLVVESRRVDCEEGVRWEAGPGTSILLSQSDRQQTGTSVTLTLKPEYRGLSESPETLENIIKEYADFLTVPIHLNDGAARVNLINASWFHATPDPEEVELELASYFNESPLDVVPIHVETPVSVSGALYVSPQRTPGFADEATVAVTVRRMVISRRIRDLVPAWASFLRGVLELTECSPTASREDLVRDERFHQVQDTINEHLYRHLEELAEKQPARLEAIVTWHRYTIAGAALSESRLRLILRNVYQWQTSKGMMTFAEILKASTADPLFEEEADQVIWYNADRRQERYLDEIFAGLETPCVHTLRSFEETLLAAMIADTAESLSDLRAASPSSPNFSESILGMSETEDASAEWTEFLSSTGASIHVASFNSKQPVMAFLNERFELARTFEELKRGGDIPKGFQRLIDAHFENAPTGSNDVVLNRDHRLIQRAMQQGTRSPLASVVRLLVVNALSTAGASASREASNSQMEDLDWIAEALWGRD